MSRGTAYTLAHGVLIEPLGEQWAAYSPASGETHLVNDTGAALLEIFSGDLPLTLAQACEALAADVGSLSPQAGQFVTEALQTYLNVGLVRSVSPQQPLPSAP